jgi:hypothetical protein
LGCQKALKSRSYKSLDLKFGKGGLKRPGACASRIEWNKRCIFSFSVDNTSDK